ncbi:MAG: hypothetical protein NTX28_01910 [Novosphingobium sp.]|nr:hypothetical protein [Novosphingobium sp.]
MTIRAAALFAIASLALVAPVAVPAKAPDAASAVRFGPFAVVSADKARLVGVTDGASPAAFLAMIEAHPAIRSLELVDCAGTRDDIANLRLGRMIRQHGIATIAPAGAAVRSGAVDLFLAGSTRRAADDARFAVHAWLATDGREGGSGHSDDPARAAYERYYRDMGLTEGDARAFYALTASVPNNRPLQLGPRDLARFAKVVPAS